MKRTFLFIALAAACISVVAANFQVKQTNVKRTWPVTAEGQEFAPEGFTPGVDATIDFPTGNDRLSQTIIKWMASRLGVDEVVYSNAEELIDAHVNYLKTSGEGVDMTSEFSITKVYETSTLVSYEMQGYDYNCGAAHGMPYCNGVTFSKSDCKDLSNSLLKRNAHFSFLLKEALKKYFEVKSDNELSEILFESNLRKIEAPSNSPWVVEGGIMFQYGAYEIAPFAAGMPEALISVKDLTPYLTPEAIKCIKAKR